VKPVTRLSLTALVALATALTASANTNGAPIKMTGALADGVTDCSTCHNFHGGANSDSLGRITLLTAATYTPGVKQNIDVRIDYPNGSRWGFELTARPVSAPSTMAGTFTTSPTVQVECNPGGTSPCGGELEFAVHRTAAVTAQSASYTFSVEWTPPLNEIGAIVFYASGSAATSGAAQLDDHIYTTSLTLAANGACNQTVRPTLRTISNGASFNGTLAPNAMASVFGLNFAVSGRSRTAATGDFVNGSFPKELACVAVEIGGQRAAIAYVQTDQINFQMPAGIGVGPIQAMVVLNPGRPNELRSDVATITVANYAPAFFTFNGSSVAALTADYQRLADPAVVPGAVKAKPGDVVLLYGTGFGATNPALQAGDIAGGLAPIRDPFTVSIGGLTLAPADVLYGGLSPQSISGLYQFNVRIPATAANGDLPVSITIGGISTQATSTIPVQR